MLLFSRKKNQLSHDWSDKMKHKKNLVTIAEWRNEPDTWHECEEIDIETRGSSQEIIEVFNWEGGARSFHPCTRIVEKIGPNKVRVSRHLSVRK